MNRSVPAFSAARRRQQGLALIMAVLVVTLAATLMAFAAWRLQVRLRDAELRQDSEQAQLLLRGLITIARTALIDDYRNDQRQRGRVVDDPTEMLFTHREDTAVEKGRARGYVEDASGRFNLNELRSEQGAIDPDKLEIYRRLLRQLNLDRALADNVAEWLDSDEESQTGGPEDMGYLGRERPYRTANRALGDYSELLDVQGYTPQILETLRPHVTVQPLVPYDPAQGAIGSININFATPELLAAVLPDTDLATARALTQQVRSEPFRDFDDFRRRLPEGLRALLQNEPEHEGRLRRQLSCYSRFFVAQVSIEYGRVQWREAVLLRRINRDDTEVISRRRLPP